MSEQETLTALSSLLEGEKDRIVRLWAKRLRAESSHLDIEGRDLRSDFRELLEQLARLLRERGEAALDLWPEWVRGHGIRRYDQRFEADDLAREFKVLGQVLFQAFAKRQGGLPLEAAELISELVGEASAAAQAAFARVLRTEEVRFRDAAVMESVLHQVDVGILVAELDGTLSFATPPLARILGLPVRALVGAKAAKLWQPVLNRLRAKHPDGTPFRVHELPLLRALEEHLPVKGVQMVIDRVDGQEALLEMNATPLWEEGPEGEMVGAIQTLSDRTEAAAKTQELAHAYEEMRTLQGRLLQRTRTHALGQLASGAAHALNNFLNVLRLRLTLLRREYKPEHVDAIDRTVKNIGELVARLQEFSIQRTEETLEDVSFDEVVREALQLARPELERPEAPVEVDAHFDAPGCVHADVGFFRELIVNLLLAARDRMDRGGRLTLRSEGQNEGLVLRIEDSGPHPSVDELQRMFDPLKGNSLPPHLALLLAVARNQIQRWGGSLDCLNIETGAAFELKLPKVDMQPRPETPSVQERHLARKLYPAQRVLVVDDDADNARMMAEVLSEEGYQVVVADSGEAALRLWAGQTFQAALLDALMPDMSGWELARELRRRSPEVLLAMVTGMDVRGQNRSNLALVDAVFRKPIDVGALDDFLSQGAKGEPQLSALGPQPLHS